jgi:hypothetical protein
VGIVFPVYLSLLLVILNKEGDIDIWHVTKPCNRNRWTDNSASLFQNVMQAYQSMRFGRA